MTGALVLTGVELEARRLARELELPRSADLLPFPVYEGSRNRVRLRVVPVGLRAALLPDRWPALTRDLASPVLIAAGSCGALAPGLAVGDLVLPESVLGPAGERLNVTPGLHAAAVRLAAGAWTGLLLSSSEVIATPEAKAERWRATGASAVDMESAAILAWASRHGSASVVVRAVSDTALQLLPGELVGLVTRAGSLRHGRALVVALTYPRAVPHALVLHRGTRMALKAVARLIAALVG
ncbi:MAG: hypothetical protein HY726_16020 [Candidatus Rokubacteria bacterium]|nr:hypothetical protein [Candidatus Rokubacteria bacterium]